MYKYSLLLRNKILIKPVIFLISVVLILTVTIFIGINQISSLISKTNESKAVEVALNQKISILQKVTEVISGDTTFLDVVIPSKAAVLYGLSQIKNQAAINGLLVSNIKTGASVPDKNEIFKNQISFDVEGNAASVYNFLGSFSKILPLMNIEKIKINESSSIVRAVTTLSIYSSQLPKTIPSVSSVAVDFSDSEIKLLNELTSYTLPLFVEPKAEEVNAKEDPFN